MHFIFFKTLEKDQQGSSFLVKSQGYNTLTCILQIFTNSTFNEDLSVAPSKIIYKERWIFTISKPEHFAAIVLLDVVGFLSWHRFLISFALLFD